MKTIMTASSASIVLLIVVASQSLARSAVKPAAPNIDISVSVVESPPVPVPTAADLQRIRSNYHSLIKSNQLNKSYLIACPRRKPLQLGC
jgi:hypothetical protein